MKAELIVQGGSHGFSLAAAMKAHVLRGGYDRLDVAVAYATYQGVCALQRVVQPPPNASRWLLGLDDAITQPAALIHLTAQAGAVVHVAKLAPTRRFHPKLYRLWSSTDPARSLMVVGSGNMTQRGLQENAEAGVRLQAETLAEAQEADQAFLELWHLGHCPDAAELNAYALAHKAAAQARQSTADRKDAPTEPLQDRSADDIIPSGRTVENVIATAVARIAANHPSGVCSFDEARRLIPRMIALTPGDLATSNSQNNAKWIQLLRNIKSNSSGGTASTNFIALGYLEHVPGTGYRVTPAGRALIEAGSYSAAME